MSNFQLQIWMANSMFILGLLVFVVGIWLILLPQHFLKIATLLGKWVSTERYHITLDKPRYQERIIYKHHRIMGSLIVLGAVYTLVIFLRLDMDTMLAGLLSIGLEKGTEWIYMAVYYLLIGGNIVATVVGIVIFIRPSVLKNIENIMNKWYLPEQNLKILDQQHNIALSILPGNPRLFGLMVALGGVYIMLTMAELLL